MLRNIALHVCAHWNMEEDNSHMFCQLLPGFIYFDKINNYLLFFFVCAGQKRLDMASPVLASLAHVFLYKTKHDV